MPYTCVSDLICWRSLSDNACIYKYVKSAKHTFFLIKGEICLLGANFARFSLHHIFSGCFLCQRCSNDEIFHVSLQICRKCGTRGNDVNNFHLGWAPLSRPRAVKNILSLRFTISTRLRAFFFYTNTVYNINIQKENNTQAYPERLPTQST